AGADSPLPEVSARDDVLLHGRQDRDQLLLSLAGTLNLLRLLARSCTSASKSLPLMPMPACTDFMSPPEETRGPPVPWQICSTRRALSRSILALAKNLLMRLSAATFFTKSSTTAEMAP